MWEGDCTSPRGSAWLGHLSPNTAGYERGWDSVSNNVLDYNPKHKGGTLSPRSRGVSSPSNLVPWGLEVGGVLISQLLWPSLLSNTPNPSSDWSPHPLIAGTPIPFSSQLAVTLPRVFPPRS